MSDYPGYKLESPRTLRVFLCHSSSDKPAVRELYRRLGTDGIDAWLDEENLLPGQEWQQEIPRAVRSSDVVIVCLSRYSINKTGYIQKEIRFALDVADEQPEDTIFLIPLKLEECDVPNRLSRWQWVNLFEENGYERLMRALHIRANSLKVSWATVQKEKDTKLLIERSINDNNTIKVPTSVKQSKVKQYELISIIIALGALIVALLNWLTPFSPIGSSPFDPNEGLSATQNVATVTTLSANTPSSSTTVAANSKPIIFSQDGFIYIKNADGTGLKQLSDSDRKGYDQSPVLSPDETKIVFISARGKRSDGGDAYCIYTMNVDGSNQIRLTDTGRDWVAIWSPDGKKILFQSGRDQTPSGTSIYVMDVNGSNQIRLTPTDSQGFIKYWSAIDNKIYFVSTRRNQYSEYVMNPDGSEQTWIRDCGLTDGGLKKCMER